MPADGSTNSEDTDDAGPSEATVVETAAAAAERVIFSRYSKGEVTDYDVTVSFEDGQLSVDIYIEAPEATPDADRVADDAALAARGAVDDLF
jgi:hypothetical protein